jgi:hypothetical protein
MNMGQSKQLEIYGRLQKAKHRPPEGNPSAHRAGAKDPSEKEHEYGSIKESWVHEQTSKTKHQATKDHQADPGPSKETSGMV